MDLVSYNLEAICDEGKENLLIMIPIYIKWQDPGAIPSQSDPVEYAPPFPVDSSNMDYQHLSQ